MQLSHLLVAGAALAALGLLRRSDADADRPNPAPTTADKSPAADSNVGTAQPAAPKVAEPASGHFVLVVEGDRNGLNVTFASRKAAPWAGVPKGFDSSWRMLVKDGSGTELVDVPLDVRPFATDARHLGQPARVEGCIVIDSKIGMLVNVPAFPGAAIYEFARPDRDGNRVVIGTVTGKHVRELAGGGR